MFLLAPPERTATGRIRWVLRLVVEELIWGAGFALLVALNWSQELIFARLAGPRPLLPKTQAVSVLSVEQAWKQRQISASHAASLSEPIPVRFGSSQSEMM